MQARNVVSKGPGSFRIRIPYRTFQANLPPGIRIEPIPSHGGERMDLEVKHDEPGRRYFAVVDGRESVCDYGPAGDKTLVFSHTYVPPELRGRGIGEELVGQALV